jgi:hypothetical protein
MANTVAFSARQLGVIDKRARRVGFGPGAVGGDWGSQDERTPKRPSLTTWRAGSLFTKRGPI